MASSANGIRNGLDRLHVNGNGVKKSERKASSPMSPAFIVSAPGKVILFGEHAVVHGKVRLRTPLAALHYMTDFERATGCHRRSYLPALVSPCNNVVQVQEDRHAAFP